MLIKIFSGKRNSFVFVIHLSPKTAYLIHKMSLKPIHLCELTSNLFERTFLYAVRPSFPDAVHSLNRLSIMDEI